MEQAEPKFKKRRSFVDVGRKSVILNEIFNEENQVTRSNVVDNADNADSRMEKYLASLKEERMQWKDILKSRREQLEQLKNSCSYETAEITAEDVECYLSEEDKDFLKDEPDYLSMLEYADKYLKAVEFFNRYKADVIEHYREVVEEIKSGIDTLVENFSESHICELCNEINCSVSSHKFPTY